MLKMEVKRQVKTINCTNLETFENKVTEIFNNDEIRVIDVQNRVYVSDGITHYVSFIIYEYSEPNGED